MFQLLFRAALSAALISPTVAMAAAPYRQWVQYVPGGVEARAIMEGAQACPAIRIDGLTTPMRVRAAPGEGYPITVCAAALPAGAAAADIEGKALPLPRPNPARVLLVGDTGCRVSREMVQDCNNMDAWPFPRGSAVEAALKPDLVIHVGDFHYREAPCPLANKGCEGSPYGDKWDVWNADFFGPAQPLLEAAPFVFVRGNHEECERGGKGWSRTLDPYPEVAPSGCLSMGAPFLVDLGDQKLVVLDVSTAAELRASATQVPFFRKQFQDIARLAPTGPVWVAFHRPIWATGVSVFGFTVGDNKTLADAARNDKPANVEALLSGHIHTYQIMSYKEDLPIQIVSGNGGDDLHRTAPSDPTGMVINGVTVETGRGAPGVFGFAMLEREPGGWRATDYDMSAKPIDVCHMKGRKLACD